RLPDHVAAVATSDCPVSYAGQDGTKAIRLAASSGVPYRRSTIARSTACVAWNAVFGRDAERRVGNLAALRLSRRQLANRDDARAPRAARRLDDDLVADLAPEQRAPHGRVGRHAADAGDLDLHELALLVLDLDVRPDADRAAHDRRLVDDHRTVEAVAQPRAAALEEPPHVLGGVVFGVLGQ